MAKVTIKRSGASLAVVHLDGKKLKFEDGVATRKLDAGEHVLTWFIRGRPGDKYGVAITAPKEARFAHEDRLDETLQDAGLKWFTVK
jgi:hypothetical protein